MELSLDELLSQEGEFEISIDGDSSAGLGRLSDWDKEGYLSLWINDLYQLFKRDFFHQVVHYLEEINQTYDKHEQRGDRQGQRKFR